MKKILVTGICGYIGSHCAVELIQRGFNVIGVDHLVNSNQNTLQRIRKIGEKEVPFYMLDLADSVQCQSLFVGEKNIEGILHFAAYKSVSESVEQPLRYYQNNLNSLLNLLQAVEQNQIPNFVFSSSCTVYGLALKLPVTEDSDFLQTGSPYGRTKQMGEQILADYYSQQSKLKAISLRYFNPAGAHDSILLGEAPHNPAQNLVPVITETAYGIRNQMSIYGNDYNTFDGTCIRDYIHIMDLADAHVRALEYLMNGSCTGSLDVFNLGLGEGVSVLQAIHCFEETNGIKLNVQYAPRRAGDLAEVYADISKANTILKWTPKKNLKDIMFTAWEWEKARRVKSNH